MNSQGDLDQEKVFSKIDELGNEMRSVTIQLENHFGKMDERTNDPMVMDEIFKRA